MKRQEEQQQNIEKPTRCHEVDLQDLQKYAAISGDKHAITEVLMLQAQVQLKGLKALHDALKDTSKLATSLKANTEEEKRQLLFDMYAPNLLGDLKALSHRADLKTGEKSTIPEDFSLERLTKEATAGDKPLNGFIDECAELSSTGWYIEKFSAKMLQGLQKPLVGQEMLKDRLDTLKKTLNTDLEEYKAEGRVQSEKDIGGEKKDISRDIIILKDKDGIKAIGFKKLEKLYHSGGLKKEQFEFIATQWHQGTYTGGGGAINLLISQAAQDGVVPYLNNSDKVSLFIDLSEEGKVILQNHLNVKSLDMDTSETKEYKHAIFTADISNLKSDAGFIPGCASAIVPTKMLISEYTEGTSVVPAGVGVSDLKLDAKRERLVLNGMQAYLAEIFNPAVSEGRRVSAETAFTTYVGDDKLARQMLISEAKNILTEKKKQGKVAELAQDFIIGQHSEIANLFNPDLPAMERKKRQVAFLTAIGDYKLATEILLYEAEKFVDDKDPKKRLLAREYIINERIKSVTFDPELSEQDSKQELEILKKQLTKIQELQEVIRKSQLSEEAKNVAQAQAQAQPQAEAQAQAQAQPQAEAQAQAEQPKPNVSTRRAQKIKQALQNLRQKKPKGVLAKIGSAIKRKFSRNKGGRSP